MKDKLKIIIPLALVIAGGAYKFALAKPPAGPPPKVHGSVYALSREFLVNLKDDHFAKLGVALVISHADKSIEEAAKDKEAPKPPEGYGPLPQEAVVRDIVTDALTGRSQESLISEHKREKLKKRIVRSIHRHTDVKVEDVLFTDVAVQ